MDKNNKPYLTEASFRHLVDEQSFSRGVDYYNRGAVTEVLIRGESELSGLCSGSRYEPYRVKVVLGENGIRQASCSCPRGGFCKHIVALLLQYIHEPDDFTVMPILEEQLEGFSKKELVKLIRDMVLRDPFLAVMVERRALISNSSDVEKYSLRREVKRALRFSDPHDVEAGLRDLLQLAEELEEKEDWAGAGMVYQEVLNALASCYKEELLAVDEEGDIAVVAGECIDGLCSCLEASEGVESSGENWKVLRQAWLDTLLEAELADLMMGGVDFAAGAWDTILCNAAVEEWVLLEGRLRQIIPGSSVWQREMLVGMLEAWHKRKGRDNEADEIIHEMGTESQKMFLLVREGKQKEAAAMAKQHFTMQPGTIVGLAKEMADRGAAEFAVALLTELLQDSKTAHPRYREWLAKQRLAEGDLEAALKWQYEVVLHHPTVEEYQILRELGEKLKSWEKVRTRLLSALEDKKAWDALLQIALHEGQVDRALELLPQVPFRGWRNYREEVAKAAEKERPRDAVVLYREMSENAIRHKQRPSYRQAAKYLSKMKTIYNRLGKPGECEKYIARLRKEYARYPALQDELDKAGL